MVDIRGAVATTYAQRTNTSVNLPAGVQVGDYTLAVLQIEDESLGAVTLPSGWDVLAQVADTGTASAFALHVIGRRRQSGDPTSLTFTHASQYSGAATIAYSDVHASTALDAAVVTTTGTTSGAGANAVLNGLTTVSDGAMLVAIRASWDGSAVSPPSGWTERVDAVLWAGDRVQAADGPSGTVTVGSGNGAGASKGWVGAVVALRPTGGGGGPVAPTITTSALSPITRGASFSQTLAATGDAPITWSVQAGSLPAGLSLNGSTGALTGTPTGAWAYDVTIRATNATGSDDQQYTGVVQMPGESSRTIGTTSGSTPYTRLVLSLSGDPAICYVPTGKTLGSSSVAVIMAHGASDDEEFPGNEPWVTTQHCLDAGWVVICPYAHGDQMGNPTWQADHRRAADWVDDLWPLQRVIGYGASMGGFGWILGYVRGEWDAYPLAGIVTIDAQWDLAEHWAAGGDWQRTLIRDAYAISPDSAFTTATAGYRPEDYLSSAYAGLRALWCYSEADEISWYTVDALPFAAHVDGVADLTLHETTGEHYAPENFAPTTVNAWLDELSDPSGTAAGSITWAGSATGRKTSKGAAAGALGWASAATGRKLSKGAATGAIGWAGSAAGRKVSKGSAAGGIGWAGSATGSAPTPGVSEGSASGSIGWAGSATGRRVAKGSASGATAWAGSATGRNLTKGSAAGSIGWAGGATGRRLTKGAASGAVVWTGSAIGDAPSLGTAAGTATGSLVWAGSAAGRRLSRGSATGAVEWAGSATGSGVVLSLIGEPHHAPAVTRDFRAPAPLRDFHPPAPVRDHQRRRHP